MLSKRKMAEATMTWVREQLEDAQNRGMSLCDDVDGDAVRIERVRQSGSFIFLDISAISHLGSNKFEYCLSLAPSLQHKPLQGDILGYQPTAEDLREIDNTP